MRLLARAFPLLLALLTACASHTGGTTAPPGDGAEAGQGGAGQAGAGQAGAGAAGAAGQASGGAGQSGAAGQASGGGGQGGKTPVGAEIRYLSLGDSFTIGTGTTPDKSFPARLVARWQAAGQPAELRNPAVNGYTSQKILDVEGPELPTFKPTFVTLAAGANDIVQGRSDDDFRGSVKALIKAVLAVGVAPKLLVTIPQPDWPSSPVGASFGDPASLRTRIATLNGILRDETQAVGGRYVDLSALMAQQADKKMFGPDGLHPSAEAYDAWAAALFDALPDLHP